APRGRPEARDLDVDPQGPRRGRDPLHRARRPQGAGRAGLPGRSGQPAASRVDPAAAPGHHRVPRRALGRPPHEGKGPAMKPDVWIPDGLAEGAAFARTTHMGVVAHPDDLEIEGYPGIVECFGRDDCWFCGVVVTDGAGSARGGPYAKVTNDEMVQVRRKEQQKAAMVGEYGAMVMLGVTSAAIKDPARPGVVETLADLLRRARPEVVYTHNLADKHDTHVSVALATIDACRSLPAPAPRAPRPLSTGGGAPAPPRGARGLARPALSHRRRQARPRRLRPREPVRR